MPAPGLVTICHSKPRYTGEMERSDALVFFGATGDLAYKQIFPALQALTKRGQLDIPVVAVGRKDVPIEELRAKARKSIEENAKLDEDAFAKLSKNLAYAKVDYDDASSFQSIVKALGGAKRPLHYVALPPETFESVAKDLDAAGLAKGARLALEKPFGSDIASAKALSKALHAIFPEEAIFRIDHFLGKEPVENIVYFRAANPFVESSFCATDVDRVEITMAEKFGVEGRAKFYDAVGAIRDVVQNHLIQLVACLAMELPSGSGHEALRDARSKVVAQMRTLRPEDVVRGQVEGYLAEEGVEKGSKTETFAALRLFVDTPRWKDVPFYIRTGKSMATTVTEAQVVFKAKEAAVLEDDAPPPPNRLRFALGKAPATHLAVNTKKGGTRMTGEPHELTLKHDAGDDLPAYARLIGDALVGDAQLFAREDATFESWRIVEPILGNTTPLHTYAKGSWGPEEAAKVGPQGGWGKVG